MSKPKADKKPKTEKPKKGEVTIELLHASPSSPMSTFHSPLFLHARCVALRSREEGQDGKARGRQEGQGHKAQGTQGESTCFPTIM